MTTVSEAKQGNIPFTPLIPHAVTSACLNLSTRGKGLNRGICCRSRDGTLNSMQTSHYFTHSLSLLTPLIHSGNVSRPKACHIHHLIQQGLLRSTTPSALFTQLQQLREAMQIPLIPIKALSGKPQAYIPSQVDHTHILLFHKERSCNHLPRHTWEHFPSHQVKHVRLAVVHTSR